MQDNYLQGFDRKLGIMYLSFPRLFVITAVSCAMVAQAIPLGVSTASKDNRESASNTGIVGGVVSTVNNIAQAADEKVGANDFFLVIIGWWRIKPNIFQSNDFFGGNRISDKAFGEDINIPAFGGDTESSHHGNNF